MPVPGSNTSSDPEAFSRVNPLPQVIEILVGAGLPAKGPVQPTHLSAPKGASQAFHRYNAALNRDSPNL